MNFINNINSTLIQFPCISMRPCVSSWRPLKFHMKCLQYIYPNWYWIWIDIWQSIFISTNHLSGGKFLLIKIFVIWSVISPNSLNKGCKTKLNSCIYLVVLIKKWFSNSRAEFVPGWGLEGCEPTGGWRGGPWQGLTFIPFKPALSVLQTIF